MNNPGRIEAGLKILGVYLTIQGLYGLVSAVAVAINGGWQAFHNVLFAFIHPLVFFVSAYLLLRQTKTVLRFVDNNENTSDSDPA